MFGYVPEAEDAFIKPEGKDKLGYFKIADKGTISLNEINELRPARQEKLLQILRDKELTRVASTLPQKIDVLIISATNRDLEAEIKNGNFSNDLYRRLCETVIDIPQLS